MRRLHTAVFTACVVTGVAALFVESRWRIFVVPLLAPGLWLGQFAGRPGSLPFQVVVVAGNVAAYALVFWSALAVRDIWRRRLDSGSGGDAV